MKTQLEIVARLRERRERDMLGFETSEYLRGLTKETLSQLDEFDPAKVGDWTPDYQTDEDVLGVAKDYVEFAYSKINGRRGISAERTVMHYVAWLWLVDSPIYDEMFRMYSENYHAYGREILNFIVDHYKWPKPERADFGAWEIAPTGKKFRDQYAEYELTNELWLTPKGWEVRQDFSEMNELTGAISFGEDKEAAYKYFNSINHAQ
jgi:hypothetical protein